MLAFDKFVVVLVYQLDHPSFWLSLNHLHSCFSQRTEKRYWVGNVNFANKIPRTRLSAAKLLQLVFVLGTYKHQPMSYIRIIVLTSLAMVAFASNSLLCRVALLQTHIDPASFTLIRLVSGAIVLWLIVQLRRDKVSGRGNWLSAFALFVYAAGFSFAYVVLPTATGALLLFAAVQASMIGFGIWTGERMRRAQTIGLALAFIGLIGLLLPGISAPNLFGSVSMLSAGIAWGVYSLRGKGVGAPIQVTAGNFIRAVPIAGAMNVVMFGSMTVDGEGACYAIASGALASGIGYSIWYTALPGLKSIHAATVQLSVPVIAAIGGIAFLGEPITWRFLFASLAILGGIALVLSARRAHR